MPVAQTDIPSLALGVFKRALAQQSIACDIFHFNIQFASAIGEELNEILASGYPKVHDLTAEWLFSDALWGPDHSRDEGYLNQVAFGGHPAHGKSKPIYFLENAGLLQQARMKATEFIKDVFSNTNWAKYDLIGFSTSYQQTTASLALAVLIKAAFPNVRIIFGGANCEERMGLALIKAFSFIDAVCLGEGDEAFINYAITLRDGGKWAGKGIVERSLASSLEPSEASASMPSPFRALETLPFPDYDDFFKAREAFLPASTKEPWLAFESSRGCWWGERSHCTFCGLNGAGMEFRSKNASRAADEVASLLSRYGKSGGGIFATDNILPMHYLEEFGEALKRAGASARFFYETKANLRRSDLEQMKSVGIVTIQPGIESLSSPVLKKMKKGTTQLRNIQLLKHAAELKMSVSWNYLYGLPDECSEDYDGQLKVIAAITHLQPPQYVGPIRIDRFSPYFQHANHYGLSLSPFPAYYYLYPTVEDDLISELSYFFFDHNKDVEEYTYISEIFNCINHWKANSKLTRLYKYEIGEEIFVHDTRFTPSGEVVKLTTYQNSILENCDNITHIETLRNVFSTLDDDEFKYCVSELEERAFIIRDGLSLLSLPLPLPKVESQQSENAPEP